ncbi:MAG TPA: nucleotide disphospho-sugar-binding domain-containing protein, partial [Levilinea sp.]|nr:nucleotide disphospho-sugar-binding domain-containing protein [Levilinea sp.]
MKPILLFGAATFNLAETTRMIEIARACGETFEPHFFGYGGQYVNFIQAVGFPFRLLQPEMTPEKIDYLYRVDRAEMYGQPFTVAELNQQVTSELGLYQHLQPAALVMGSVLSASISARVARLPLVSVVPFPRTRPYLKAGCPAIPDLIARLPLRRWTEPVVSWLLNRLLFYVPIATGNFNQVARRFGLPGFPSLLGVWEGDYNLVADIPSLTRVPHLPVNWRYIGPIYARLDSPVPPDVEALLERREKPLVYFAMGSSANKDVLVQVLEGFRGLPVQVIAPIRAHLEGSAVDVPENVLVTGWLPADKVNPRVDLAVIHGGQGTVQTACMAGIPFIGIGMQPEQDINIEEVVRFGSAVRIPKRLATPERVRAAVLRLLADENA